MDNNIISDKIFFVANFNYYLDLLISELTIEGETGTGSHNYFCFLTYVFRNFTL